MKKISRLFLSASLLFMAASTVASATTTSAPSVHTVSISVQPVKSLVKIKPLAVNYETWCLKCQVDAWSGTLACVRISCPQT